MRKNVPILLFLCLTACNAKQEKSAASEQLSAPLSDAPATEEKFTDADSVEADVEDSALDFYRPTPAELTELPLVEGPRVVVTIHSIEGYGTWEQFGRAGAAKLQQVVNSPAFRTAVLKTKFEDDQDLSSQQIYDKIIGAEETNANVRDGVIDLRMRLITAADGVAIVQKCNRKKNPMVGRDGARNGVMNTCPNWVQRKAAKKDTAAMARHIAHEYMHRFKFRHPNVNRKAVPYKIGGIVEYLAKKLK